MLKFLSICVALLCFGFIVFVIFRDRRPSQAPNTHFSVGEVKGDTLGMSVKDFNAKHRAECKDNDALCSDLMTPTYAGVSTSKGAGFVDGKLSRLVYFIDPEASDEILGGLKQKYGDPKCLAGSLGSVCTWNNGTETIEFVKGEKSASVTYSLDALVRKGHQDYEQQRQKALKTDM